MINPPLDLWPRNPRYLRFRGLPTFLLTSAEHYGAVFNLDVDYHAYLGELTRCRFNYTRTASGTFVEHESTIEGSGWENTQAPRPLRYLAPWARTDIDGYHHGGTKFDLGEISGAYLDRLIDFVYQAALRGIIVELTLFTAQYSPGHWLMSPMHPANNINDLAMIDHQSVYHLDNGGLLHHQLAFVRTIVDALINYDNVIIELINEPYFSGVERAWIDTVLDAIEHRFNHHRRRLLVAWNYANVDGRITGMSPGIDLFTFHYANPPSVIEQNFDLAIPVVYDETGYDGVDDSQYRSHAWEFMLAGGAGFNHLDYSFAPSGDDTGTRTLPGNASGGGGRRLRDQLTILRDFLADLPFANTAPVTMTARSGTDTRTIRGLADPGKAYAFYLNGIAVDSVELMAVAGDYVVRWVDPLTGYATSSVQTITADGAVRLQVPARRREVACSILQLQPETQREVGDFDFVEAAKSTTFSS
ncbi:hypothetical protein [Microlunatus soli]|uniref:Cellulase (Glycosyl hydrolase family 5) n=1 Tax=Microlunatus soli TaxID=630515 RepID=A0A1H1YLW1_9ACTN|nr:hypothetical protein [Microlunatus soli]SDT22381.1 hypothetical protein SAMN04489812_4657 [Microlunatus soli]